MKRLLLFTLFLIPSLVQALTPTNTPTTTPSSTPTATPTSTPSFTFSPTISPTPSWTPTATPTATGTYTPSATPTQTQSFTASPTPTPVGPYLPTGVSVGALQPNGTAPLYWNYDPGAVYWNIYVNGVLRYSPYRSNGNVVTVATGTHNGQQLYWMTGLNSYSMPITITMTSSIGGGLPSSSSYPVTLTANTPNAGWSYLSQMPGGVNGDGALAAVNYQIVANATPTYVNLTSESGVWSEIYAIMRLFSGAQVTYAVGPSSVTTAPTVFTGVLGSTTTATPLGPEAPGMGIWFLSTGTSTINFNQTQ